MSGPYILTLQHRPNPDIGGKGYWQTPVTPNGVTMQVDNLADARSSFESWLGANGLGSGNMGRHCGEIRTQNGQLVGRFSYNGRFWNPEGHEVHIHEGAAQ